MAIESDTEADTDEGERGDGKSDTAFRTITEVADSLDLPAHVLRFWETKFAQVRPLKRGGGRRYYRPEDVTVLRHIRSLLYNDGYTIKGAQRLLRDGSAIKAAADEAAVDSGEAESAAPAPKTGDPEAPAPTDTATPAAKLDLRTIATLTGILGELQGIKTSLDDLSDRIKRGPEPDPEPSKDA